ncbi:MAG: UDP-glucose 4-epimerase GalE [Leptolyngbyaceae cyanobacterium]
MLQTHQTILVTGGAGYVGTHAVKTLQQKGFRVVVLDNLTYGHRDLVENTLKAELVIGDICDRPFLDYVFKNYAIDAVMHFAAFAYVGESVKDPAKYYWNNVTGTLTLLQAMHKAGVNKFVFSSTCATYGIPDVIPILEDQHQNPINPYGQSKWIVEQVLAEYGAAYGLKSVCFRYFNAAGADPDGELGEDHSPETHLIPLVLQVALGQRKSVSILGTDYPTPDGTCIRDYIHVTDLAQAHFLGLQYLLEGGDSQIFNLSNGNGFSVREVVETVKTVTGRSIPVVEKARRLGDPPALVGSSEKARRVLGWQPQYSELADIIKHAWHWHQKRHGIGFAPEVSQPVATQLLESMPLVSVVIPAHNAETFLAKTLASIQSQTYSDLEILVIDDGSSDRTPDIVREFAQLDSRIQLFQQANAGVAAARNCGIQNAKGEFIAPIDADDLWCPETVEKLVSRLQKSCPDVGVVYAWSIDIDEQEQPIGGFHAATVVGNVYKTLICHNFLGNASSTLIRKTCLDYVGGYDSQLKAQNAQGCEDWDLYLRLAERFKFEVVPEFLVGYRKMMSSMSGNFSQMARSQQQMLQVVQCQHPEIPNFLYRLSRSSFYLHLASQYNISSGNARGTLFWLWQAIRVDPVTPFGRLGLYVLLLKSLTWLAIEELRQFAGGVAMSSSIGSVVLADESLQLSGNVITPPPRDSISLTRETQQFARRIMTPVLPQSNPARPLQVSLVPFQMSLTKTQINPLKVQLKVFVSAVLHRLLSKV